MTGSASFVAGAARGNGLKVYNARTIRDVPQVRRALSEEALFDLEVVSTVIPFRTNNYVVDELIDWSAVPDDPIFRLTFAQRGMLSEEAHSSIAQLISDGAPADRVRAAAREVWQQLNPHPGGQTSLNVPFLEGEPLQGLQHKYRETCLVFPSHGQTCHAYCAYCFRWPQFVGEPDLRIATSEATRFGDYLRAHPAVTDVLVTGGDPLIMSASVLARYVEPLLDPSLEHVQSIRIGTKAFAYWPYRFLTDGDADELLRLFERISAGGKHLAVMAHFSHPRELETTCAGGRRPCPLRRRGDSDAGADRPRRQRRARDLGPDVDGASPARVHSLLHVRRARNRGERVLRGPARRGDGDVRGCVPTGVRTCANGSWPVHGDGRREGRDRG